MFDLHNILSFMTIDVVKFFTKRRPNMEAITRTLRSMWRSGGAFEIRELGSKQKKKLFFPHV